MGKKCREMKELERKHDTQKTERNDLNLKKEKHIQKHKKENNSSFKKQKRIG